MKTLDEQIACAERELAMRRSAYPKWIRTCRITLDKAEHETECMAAIVDTLRQMREIDRVVSWSMRKGERNAKA